MHHLDHLAENATQRSFFIHSSLHLASVADLPLRSKTLNGDPSGPHFLLLFWGSAMISPCTDKKNYFLFYFTSILYKFISNVAD